MLIISCEGMTHFSWTPPMRALDIDSFFQAVVDRGLERQDLYHAAKNKAMKEAGMIATETAVRVQAIYENGLSVVDMILLVMLR